MRGDYGPLGTVHDDDTNTAEALIGLSGGFFAAAFLWVVYSVIRGLWALFQWASSQGHWYVIAGSVSVTGFGAVAAWLFVRWPRAFGGVELLASASLGAYFGHRLTVPPVDVLEQVANIVGAVFLFADGIRTIRHSRQAV